MQIVNRKSKIVIQHELLQKRDVEVEKKRKSELNLLGLGGAN